MKFFCLFISSIIALSAFAQNDMKIISQEELIEKIEAEPSDIFTLKDHIVTPYFNSMSNLVIDKELRFENVIFNSLGGEFQNITFNESCIFENSGPFWLQQCTFKKGLTVIINDNLKYDAYFNSISEFITFKFKSFSFSLDSSVVENNLDLNLKGSQNYSLEIYVNENQIENNDFRNWNLSDVSILKIDKNVLNLNRKQVTINTSGREISLVGNEFLEGRARFVIGNHETLFFTDNHFSNPTRLSITELNTKDYVNYEDFDKGLINSEIYHKFEIEILGFEYYMNLLEQDTIDTSSEQFFLDTFLIRNQFYFNNNVAFKGIFLTHYKEQINKDWSNLVYVDIKDSETKRFKYLYKENPSFQLFFQWKINQFLKTFSEYGTKPSKAVLVSVYTIFIFAFFYMFFPNSWDSRNRHKLLHRILFFTKYFKIPEGMQHVYETENKSTILNFKDFRDYMNDSKSDVPPYFIALSRPIYYLSVLNYSIRSSILSRADILKGKWKDLSPKRKTVTSFVMALWLIVIVIYDLIIKFFNSLMLSINTFSTLGFGEIPIKGIPRYLAIIQGFIGWFMLTIFAVSLISQLLS